MKVDFQVTFTARCDMDDAEQDYERYCMNNYKPEEAIYEAVKENLICSKEASKHIPQSVIETFANALRTRVGGVQMRMEDLPSFPTLWWEDSVWKK